ncbi:MAG: ShlB/FhaC/HecB family hemolysin secretion/activation protein [Rubrivivax sp.]|nr:ShlB/FhaC/HecB family hemolysin secretion/activation protein [Rubrivivax sp.]
MGRAVLLAAATLSLASTAALAADPAPRTPVASATVDVKRYDIQGNALLTTEDLQARLAAFTGRATLERLRAAAAAVQDAYRQAGWGGVVAFLPEQDLKEGVVRIRVVEGKLGKITVEKHQQFSRDNILASLPSLKAGVTPPVRLIDAEIQLANENPAKTVQVLLQPGDQPGTVAAAVTVQEQPVQRFSARLDNTGGKNIGRWRAALGWQHANVGDADHVFAAEFQTAPQDPSAVRVLSGSYRAPLYGRALAFDAYAAWSNVDAGKVGSAAGDLQFSGKGVVAGARLSAYLARWRNIDQRLIGGLEWRDYLNNCTIDGLPQGACGAAGASVSVQPLSLTYTAQASGEWRWGLSAGVHHNLAAGGSHSGAADFDAVRSGSQRRYTLLRGQAHLSIPVLEGSGISARVSTQYSREPLVPGEMFGAGGAGTVRGFEERELSGDSGAVLTLEFNGPDLADGWLPGRGADLRLVAFADAAYLANRDDAPCLAGRHECHMGSLGAGLRLAWSNVQLRLDVARAMSTGPITAKGDVRAHLSLNVAF